MNNKRKKEIEKSSTVLVVDDMPMCCKLLGRMIATLDRDLTIVYCKDGVEAVKSYLSSGTGQVLCIFMDINMPRLNGFETCRQIRNLEALSITELRIPIIACSSDQANFVEAINCGMDFFTSKPISFDFVRQQIELAKMHPTHDRTSQIYSESDHSASPSRSLESKADSNLRLMHRAKSLMQIRPVLGRTMSQSDLRHDGKRVRSHLPGIKHIVNGFERLYRVMKRSKVVGPIPSSKFSQSSSVSSIASHNGYSRKCKYCKVGEECDFCSTHEVLRTIGRTPRSFPGPQLTCRARLCSEEHQLCVRLGRGLTLTQLD